MWAVENWEGTFGIKARELIAIDGGDRGWMEVVKAFVCECFFCRLECLVLVKAEAGKAGGLLGPSTDEVMYVTVTKGFWRVIGCVTY